MIRTAACLALFVAASASAQDNGLRETMRPLDYLVGQWEGPAWYVGRDGARVDVLQTEDVYAAAGGHVIVVQGTGYALDADGAPGEATYNAFGVVSRDPETGGYLIDAFNEGRHIRTDLVPTEDGFEWGFEAGGRSVRYVMRLDEEGRWVETGSVMTGPDRWMDFVQMTLSRVGE
jgi:hypothetical protein